MCMPVHLTSSSVTNNIFNNPCFVSDTELSLQSVEDYSVDVLEDRFENVSLSSGTEKLPAVESLHSVHSRRKSICSASSVPLEQLENFLSDACSNSLEDPTIVDLRKRLSEIHLEDYPTSGLQGDYPRWPVFWRLDRWMQSFPVNLLTTLCILSDIGVVLTDVIANSVIYQIEVGSTNDYTSENPNSSYPFYARDNYVLVDFVFSVYLLVELLLRIIAVGLILFVQQWHNDLDALVTLSTFAFSLVDLVVDDTSTSNGLQILQTARLCRLFRIVRVFRICTMKKRLANAARLMVSRNKRRYQHDGFDLDLTYVTDKVIAMSFPSSGNMSFYRNPISEVIRFLDTKHPNCYKVYNLCSEHSYNPSYFHGRVENFSIDDHNVPTVRQMIEFTASVRDWLESDPKNVIAVHCKGGKGRTGTMICVWLVEAELFLKAEDSLVYFGSRRTDTRYGHAFQGVETPSQVCLPKYLLMEFFFKSRDSQSSYKEYGSDLIPTRFIIGLNPERANFLYTTEIRTIRVFATNFQSCQALVIDKKIVSLEDKLNRLELFP